MIINGFYDYDMREIDTDKIYYDVQNDVKNIRIISIHGEYFAQPAGLDAEALKGVSRNLTAKMEHK